MPWGSSFESLEKLPHEQGDFSKSGEGFSKWLEKHSHKQQDFSMSWGASNKSLEKHFRPRLQHPKFPILP